VIFLKGIFGFGKKEIKKYLVQYDREHCIGAGTCEVLDPKHWKVPYKGKADLIGSKINNNLFELAIGESELENMKKAAAGCPKKVIRVFDENGKKII
jgi:ferredoxin